MLNLGDTTSAIRDLPFAVIDLETSGGVPVARWDREGRFHPASEITEVGAVFMAGPVVQDSFESLCAVDHGIPSFIQSLTGITPAMLADAPAWERVALRLATLLEGRVWVAHNAPFDGSFLKAWLPEGLWKRHRIICTRKLSKALIPEASSRSLGNLCELLGIHNRRAHRALADAEATAELMQILIQRADMKGLDAEAFLKLGATSWGVEKAKKGAAPSTSCD